MTNEEYIQITEQHPKLTVHGYGVSIDKRRYLTAKQREEAWDQAREDLVNAHQEFEYCCQWIQDNPELAGKRIAYHWKHSVEYWLRSNRMKPDYIGQGVFILAAFHMGYKVHRIRKSDGARIGKKIA